MNKYQIYLAHNNVLFWEGTDLTALDKEISRIKSTGVDYYVEEIIHD